MNNWKKFLKERRAPSIFGRQIVRIINSPENISLENVFRKVETFLSPFSDLVDRLDGIYIGEFDFLIEQELNALYDDGVIYVSSFQSNEEDMVDDIVHEFSHFIETIYAMLIYSDGHLAREFLGKRRKLWYLLDQEHPLELFLNPEYSEEMDHILYQQIGYAKLRILASNLFPSPYSITSLREYYGVGFEYFFMNLNRERLATECPVLYDKLLELQEIESEGYK